MEDKDSAAPLTKVLPTRCDPTQSPWERALEREWRNSSSSLWIDTFYYKIPVGCLHMLHKIPVQVNFRVTYLVKVIWNLFCVRTLEKATKGLVEPESGCTELKPNELLQGRQGKRRRGCLFFNLYRSRGTF